MAVTYNNAAKKWRELQDKSNNSSSRSVDAQDNTAVSNPTSTEKTSFTRSSDKPVSYSNAAKKWREMQDLLQFRLLSSGCGCLCVPCRGTRSSGVLRTGGLLWRVGCASGRMRVPL